MEEESRKSIPLKDIEIALKNISSIEDLRPYKDLGNGLYKLHGYIITNRKGLEEYLKRLENALDKI